jgi:hypothetical protein
VVTEPTVYHIAPETPPRGSRAASRRMCRGCRVLGGPGLLTRSPTRVRGA